MKVLLVRPPRIKQAIALGEFMFSEPIGLEMVYAALKKDHKPEIFDMMADTTPIFEKFKSFKPDVVAITSLCIDVSGVIEISNAVKSHDSSIEVIVGGTQAYLNPDAFKTDSIDHVMKFTTRKNLELLYGSIKDKNHILVDGVLSKHFNYENSSLTGRNEYIIPDRESTRKYRDQYSYFGYRPAAIMATSTGCSSKCSFCLRWRLEGFEESYFGYEGLKNDILNIKEDTIMIYDNDFLHSPEHIDMFCDIIEELKIEKNFICYGSVNSISKNMVQVSRFKRLGLKAVLVGYETFRDEELQSYNKSTTVKKSLEISKFMRSQKIDVWASFMVHPDWSKDDFSNFRRYIADLSPQVSTFSPLTPFPNLPLYKEFKDRLIVKKTNYSSWSFGQVCIRPSKMSLKDYYFEILKTNFYINLITNNIFYMTKKFGISRTLHLAAGSFELLKRYIKLMKNA